MRRTHISDEALLAIFEGKKPALPFSKRNEDDSVDDSAPPPPPRMNSVASQCELDGDYMELCDVLIRSQQTGVLTVQHARERRAVQLWSDQLLLDVRLEERYHRDKIMADRREVMELMRTMLLALAPISTTFGSRTGAGAARIRGGGVVGSTTRESPRAGEVSPTRGSSSFRSTRSLSPNGQAQLQMGPTTGSASNNNDSYLAPALTATGTGALIKEALAGEATEVERLQERIVDLERQLAQKMRLDWFVSPQSQGSHPAMGANLLLGNLPQIEVDFASVQHTFVVLEQHEREETLAHEAAAFSALMHEHKLFVAEATLVAQRRFLVPTPYNAYRPRIPIQHSLKGEEFLRRWLLAETFKHYEDVTGQLQQWENEVRCEIEDEAFSVFPLLRAQVFEPLFAARCDTLEGELVELRYLKIRTERDASVLATAAKLKLLSEAEERARQQVAYFERLDRERIGEVGSSLAVLKDVQKTVDRLKGELSRATVRHREELIGLHQHLTALDEEGREKRQQEGEEKYAQYLESAFVRGSADEQAGRPPLYETLLGMRPHPTVAAPPLAPAPPPAGAEGGLRGAVGPPRSGRRASLNALGASVVTSTSAAPQPKIVSGVASHRAETNANANEGEPLGSSRSTKQLTPRRLQVGENAGDATKNSPRLSNAQHAAQAKDIYSRSVHRKVGPISKQGKSDGKDVAFWAGF